MLAGAGSGKTRVIVEKIAHLIGSGRYPARRIAAITFTNKSAKEMRERVAKRIRGDAAEGLTISTFHALGLRLIGKATGEKPDIPDWATDGRPRSAASGTCSASSLAKTSQPLVSGSQRRCGTPSARQASAPDGACDSDHL